MLVLAGEAGIGKSALAEAIATEAAQQRFRVLTGRAWEFADAPPYFPVRGGLRALGVAPAVPAASAADAFGLWEDLLEALARESEKAPILWWIEDLHAADAQSLELLTFLAQPLRALSVLVLLTVRTGAAHDGAPLLPRLLRLMRDATTLELTRLRAADVAALAARVAGRSLPAGSIDAWMAKTGGNPLFVVECARAVRGGRRVESALPETVVQVVVERLRGLPGVTRGLLEQGAVLGRDFAAATLARIAQRLPAAAIDGLLPALRSGLLEELGPGRFRFTHALVRDAIEDAMDGAERKACHARAEAALAEQGEAPDIVIERARHAIEALGAIPEPHARELVRRAVQLLEAEAARDRALALFRRWLEASTATPDLAALLETARLATAAGNHGEATRASQAASALARAARDPIGAAQAALAEGANLRPGIVDKALVRTLEQALAGLEDAVEPQLACRLRARLSAALIPTVDSARPVALARESIALARASGDAALLREVLFVAGSALTDFADVAETRAIADELLTLALAAGDNERALRAYTRRALDQLSLGDVAAFDLDAEHTLALARATGHPAHAWRPLLLGSMRALAFGRFEESERLVTEVEQMANLSDDPALQLSLIAHKAHRALALDQPTEIRERFAEMAPVLEFIPEADVFRPPILALFALRLDDHAELLRQIPALTRLGPESALDSLAFAGEAVARAGTPAQCAASIAMLSRFAGREIHGGHIAYTYEGPVTRLLGLLEASLGRSAAAEAQLAAAHERCRALGLKPWVARLALERGIVTQSLGRSGEARVLLTEAAVLATELGMHTIAVRARRALGEEPAAPAARATVGEAPAFSADAASDHAPLTLTCEGEVWHIARAGRSVRVRDSRGVQLLAKLAASPGERIHALALAGDGDSGLPDSDAGEALDPKALGEYRARLSEIDTELADAETLGDAARAERYRHERELLAAEIARAVGLGGRLRKIGSASEKARINVTRRLKDAIARISEIDAELGRHLESAVRTGTYCSYRAR